MYIGNIYASLWHKINAWQDSRPNFCQGIFFLLCKVLGKFLCVPSSTLGKFFFAWQGAWQVSQHRAICTWRFPWAVVNVLGKILGSFCWSLANFPWQDSLEQQIMQGIFPFCKARCLARFFDSKKFARLCGFKLTKQAPLLSLESSLDTSLALTIGYHAFLAMLPCYMWRTPGRPDPH